MTTLLRIDSSARTVGSHTRALADYFLDRWATAYPKGRVIRRDLARSPVPHLDTDTVQDMIGAAKADSASRGLALSDELIEELVCADQILLTVPMYNFTIPSTLKAYLDHIVRIGRTVALDDGRYTGLLSGKAAWVIMGRGGLGGTGDSDDHLSPYLRRILTFVGIERIGLIALEGTAAAGDRAGRLAAAQAQIDRTIHTMRGPEWIGELGADDRREIRALSTAQAEAIERGDAAAYAALCSHDVLLMIPGHEVVAGRDALQAVEASLFSSSTFASFRKTPHRIERRGEFAIEIGDQEVAVEGRPGGRLVFAPRQKYMHVFRKGPEGWRFSMLMSNATE